MGRGALSGSCFRKDVRTATSAGRSGSVARGPRGAGGADVGVPPARHSRAGQGARETPAQPPPPNPPPRGVCAGRGLVPRWRLLRAPAGRACGHLAQLRGQGATPVPDSKPLAELQTTPREHSAVPPRPHPHPTSRGPQRRPSTPAPPTARRGSRRGAPQRRPSTPAPRTPRRGPHREAPAAPHSRSRAGGCGAADAGCGVRGADSAPAASCGFLRPQEAGLCRAPRGPRCWQRWEGGAEASRAPAPHPRPPPRPPGLGPSSCLCLSPHLRPRPPGPRHLAAPLDAVRLRQALGTHAAPRR